MRMTEAKALELLAIPAETPAFLLRPEMVDGAYRRAIMANHPDTGTLKHSMAELQEAREVLRQAAAGQNNPCRQCNGRGRVPFKVGTAPCGACKGTGETT